MSQKPIIAIGGENLIDFVQSGTENGEPTFAANPGGSPFNVAVGASRQGADVHYLSPISNDDLGDMLADRLTDSGVTLAAKRRDEPTSRAIVTLTDGIPSYEFHRDGTAERCVDLNTIQDAMPENTSVLHVGSLAMAAGADADAWAKACKIAYDNGIFVSLDPNIRASLIDSRDSFMTRLEGTFHTANLIKLSDEDLEWIYPDFSLDQAVERLLNNTSAALLVLTRGPDGASGYLNGEVVHIKAPKVDPLMDTVGAGDTFMATLITTLADHNRLSNDRIREMDQSDLTILLNRAGKAAAMNCEQSGCNPPSLDALENALKG